MPIYEFVCEAGHKYEEVYLNYKDAPRELYCTCGLAAKRIVSATTFKFAGVPVINDSGDVWDGTPLADVDKVNPLTYKSDNLFFDQSKKTVQGGQTKQKPTSGAGALGV